MSRLISDKYREVQQTMLNRINQLKAKKEALNHAKEASKGRLRMGMIMPADSVSPAFAGR